MARVLIVGDEGRGLLLAEALVEGGHAARLVVAPGTPEAAGAGTGPIPAGPAAGHPAPERFAADPSRLGTIRPALERVTVACWLFGSAAGPAEEVEAWHGRLLEAFIRQLVDSSARGLLYEAAGPVDPDTLSRGETLASELAGRHAIGLALVRSDPRARQAWLGEALAGATGLLEGG